MPTLPPPESDASLLPSHGQTEQPRHGRTGGPPADLFSAAHSGVSRLYTVAMMADLLGVGRATVRHWRRVGLITPAHSADSIDWYDYATLVVTRDLSRLLASGLSLREISQKLNRFAGGNPEQAAALASRVVIDGRRLSLRQSGTLLAAGGQRQFDFYIEGIASGSESPPPDTASASGYPALLPIRGASDLVDPESAHESEVVPTTDELLDLAADLEAAGSFIEAAEALRAVLQAEGPSAGVTFMLAESLYRSGDLPGARERYYVAVELDPDHLEARTSLGCVLAEQGDFELAAAAFEGVLRQQPDYADAHWHLAGVLTELDQPGNARQHLLSFLALAPESPWADVARDQLAHYDHEPAGTP